MGVFDRGIRGNVQSPFNSLGDASTLGYANPRLPQAFAGNVQLALDYFADALYPNYKGTVPNKAALPTTATVNDYYIVADDGDGKSAGYVYSSLQGMTSWIKRYDVDYSAEGVLAEAMTRTSYMYVSKYGATDKDKDGNDIVGQFAGQTVYGGETAGQNLTLFGNKTAALDGLIQAATHLLPTQNNVIDIGNLGQAFRYGIFGTSVVAGATAYSDASINASGRPFSFGTSTVTTTGNVQANQLQLTTLTLNSSGITDSSGTVSFGNNLVKTTGAVQAGSITAGVNSKIADFTFTNGSIQTASAAITLNNVDVTNVKNLTASTKIQANEVAVGATQILSGAVKTSTGTVLTLQGGNGGTGTTLNLNSSVSAAQDLTVAGAGVFQLGASVATALTVGSSVKISTNADARFEALSGNVALISPNNISVTSTIFPTVDNSKDLGTTTARFKTSYLSVGLSDGTNTVGISALSSLRDINTGATSGMSLFYDGSRWLPSLPDTEIQHNTLSGLITGDAGHTQFALLAGRPGGQSLLGGSASGENLTLDSTANATKGLVQTSSTFAPSADSALDLGTSVKQFRHMYSVGLHYGLRFDQYAGTGAYPANASAKIGRVIWDTSSNQLLVDNGTSWSKVGNQKWQSDITTDGTTAIYAVNVSSAISDARSGVWQLADNNNGFERVYAKMTFTQTTVTVTTSPALPAGTYRLVGFN